MVTGMGESDIADGYFHPGRVSARGGHVAGSGIFTGTDPRAVLGAPLATLRWIPHQTGFWGCHFFDQTAGVSLAGASDAATPRAAVRRSASPRNPTNAFMTCAI